MSLRYEAIDEIIGRIARQDFDNGKTQRDHADAWNEAERQIDAMSNLELLELIDDLLEARNET